MQWLYNGVSSVRYLVFGIRSDNLYVVFWEITEYPSEWMKFWVFHKDLPSPVNGQSVDLSNYNELLIWDSELLWTSSNEQKTVMFWAFLGGIYSAI